MRGLIFRSSLLRPREILLRLRVVLAAEGDDPHPGQRAAVVGVTREHLLEERRGLRIVLYLELQLSQLVVGLGLYRLQLNGPLKLRFCLRTSLLRLQHSSEAEVCGRILGACREIRAQVGL